VTAWCSIDEAVATIASDGAGVAPGAKAHTRLEDRKVAGRRVLCPEALP
jgi:hypothetical protein